MSLLTAEDRALVERARQIMARKRKEAKKARPRQVRPTAPEQRDPRQIDADYLSWLHEESLRCIACMVGFEPMPPAAYANRIEAAHQKLAIAEKGWKTGKGRSHDRQCVPLCAWHHQHAPNACDKAQRKFWNAIGLGERVADLCADLYRAFKADEPGQPIINIYAEQAKHDC